MKMSRALRSLLLWLVVPLAVGCTPILKVKRMEPGRLNLGAARKLAVIQFEGRPKARDLLAGNLVHFANWDRHFTLTDRLKEGATVQVTGDTVVRADGRQEPLLARDEIGLRLDVTEWAMDEGFEVVEKTDKDGKVIAKEKVLFFDGIVTLAVTAFDSEGKVLIARESYRATGRDRKSTDNALSNASGEILRMFFRDITPTIVTDEIRIDDEDEQQHPILALARRGDLETATTQMEAYVEAHPSNASALYNLAVLKDVLGEYEEALKLYRSAISQSEAEARPDKNYYIQMEGACEHRLEAQQALAR